MTDLKKKYVPHLPSILALCERNYYSLLRLLPDCDSVDLSYSFEINGQLTYKIVIIETTRYTSTVQMSQIAGNTPTFLRPVMMIRLYHDAKVAEVLEIQRIKRLQPSYEYPNIKMHQRNEKFMTNLFLAEWLDFCFDQKNQKQPVSLSSKSG
ncbi:MAG: DUF1249 domain-containing protein [Pseudomonadota bacterium]